MKLIVFAVVLVVGCGAKQSTEVDEHVTAPRPQDVEQVYELRAAPPALDLSALLVDATEEARWPLSMGSHPILEPHYDIARALAEPGVGWLDLCGRGIQNRHIAGNQDLLEYLRAWCSVTSHDVANALYRLGRLENTTVLGLAGAIKLDVPDILVDNGGADDAEKLLDKSLISDLAIVDRLAASYFEVDRADDAFEINRLAIQMDHQPTDEVACRRLTRGIVVSHDLAREHLREELQGLATPHGPDKAKARPADPACVRLHDEVECWLDLTTCGTYFNHQDLDLLDAALLAAYGSWPPGEATTRTWLHVAKMAQRAMPREGAERLAVPALELALKTSLCVRADLVEISDVARGLRHDPTRNLALDTLLDVVIKATDSLYVVIVPARCQARLATIPVVEP